MLLTYFFIGCILNLKIILAASVLSLAVLSVGSSSYNNTAFALDIGTAEYSYATDPESGFLDIAVGDEITIATSDIMPSLKSQIYPDITAKEITCPNPDHVLVKRINSKLACVVLTTAERFDWTIIIGPPANFTATSGDTEVRLNWIPRPGIGYSNSAYYLEQKLSTATWNATQGIVTYGNIYPPVTITNLTNGLSYDFRVTTILPSTGSTNSGNIDYSAFSTVSATPSAANTEREDSAKTHVHPNHELIERYKDTPAVVAFYAEYDDVQVSIDDIAVFYHAGNPDDVLATMDLKYDKNGEIESIEFHCYSQNTHKFEASQEDIVEKLEKYDCENYEN